MASRRCSRDSDFVERRNSGKMAYVYILKSEKSGKYYIGSTGNIRERVRQHNSGNVTFTRNLRPLVLVLVQKYSNITEAKEIERRLKALKRRDYIDRIVKEGFIKMGAWLSGRASS